MQSPLPRWFAHRGGGNQAPENTLAGIRLAARLGFRAVEFDVMLSGDGTPVLIHDETLQRTTNGHGRVCDTPDEILFSLDAGHGERIPTLVEAANLCRGLNLLANVEIKPATGHERRTAEVVAPMVADLWYQAPVKPLISSFSLEVLEIARDLAPEIPRGVLYERVPGDWTATQSRLNAVTLHCAARHLTDKVLAEAAEIGVPVLCYTVNRKNAAKSLFERGVAGIFTDCLDCFAGETNCCECLQL